MRPTIGFDLDGVLYPWTSVIWNIYLPDKFKVKTFEQFWGQLEDDKEADKYITTLMLDDTTYGVAVPDKRALEMLARINKTYDIEYVTQRPHRYNTELWFRRFNIPSKENLYVIPNDKTPFIRSKGYDYYVEDRVKIVEKIKLHTQVILVETPWNKDYEDKNVIRVGSVLDVEKVIKKE